MQTKNITVGIQYVEADTWIWKQGLASSNYGMNRVEILAVGVSRRYTPSGSWHTETRNDGILVRHLDTETGQPALDREGMLREEVLTARQVRMAWDEYVPQRDKARAYVAKRKAALLDHRAETVERIQTALGVDDLDTVGLPYSVRSLGTIYGDGSYSREARVSTTDLATMLELAYAAGKASA